MTIRASIEKTLLEYQASKAEPFTGHELAHFVRNDAAGAVRQVTGNTFKVKGSTGLNDWAETPWIAVMDPLVTTSTQRGFYVVYLFNYDTKTVYLSLNQGVTAVEREFGTGTKQRAILEARATIMRSRLLSGHGLSTKPISLSEATPLSRSYQWGHVAGTEYHLVSLPEEAVLQSNLVRLLEVYRDLISKNGYQLEEEQTPAEPDATVEERRRLRLHERIERQTADPKKVKELRGYDCEVCGFNFKNFYGALGEGYIEAHHLVPISSLDLGMSRKVDMKTDFAVLCANCHRMVHRLDDPSDLEVLKKAIFSKIS